MMNTFLIQFWRMGSYDKEFDLPSFYSEPSKLIAQRLEVTPKELFYAFETWDFQGQPKGESLYKIHDKKYIRIYYAPDVFYLDGSVSLVRPWGNHWRGLGSYNFMWSAEPVINRGEESEV
jgi:hypothetical protein